MWGDPKYVCASEGDLHINPNSPAIDAGNTISENKTDIDSNARPSGKHYDIGADEYIKSKK